MSDRKRLDLPLDQRANPSSAILDYERQTVPSVARDFMTCARSWTGRKITRAPFEEIREIVQARYDSSAGQAIYARRINPRWSIRLGISSANLGVPGFFTSPSFIGVRAEAALVATCFNIARMMTLVGVGALLPKLQGV